MKFSLFAILLLSLPQSLAFMPTMHRSKLTAFGPTSPSRMKPLDMSTSDGSDSQPRSSRLDGNTREPTKEEVAIMDEMITKLSSAKAYDLPNAVRRAFRVVSSPRFFLRIAERVDMASDETEKERLQALAANLVSTIDALVSTTEDRLDETAKDVENVVKAASEPDSGEFLVPLSEERLVAMRTALQQLDPSSLDEGFLSTVDAWMNKSHQDGMDGMVGILQKVLQIYAGTQVSRARSQLESQSEPPAASLFETLLNVDTDEWDAEINKGLKDVSSAALLGEVQRTIESVVLGLENGSMAQRVQAEFLREMVSRIEAYSTE